MQARLIHYRLLLFLLVFLTASGSMIGLRATPVRAQQLNAGLAVSPPSFELNANPGDTITNTIRVDNLVDQTLDVTVSARNFTALGEEGQVNLTEDDSTYSLAKWITVAPATATVPARESREFTYTIKVPANAEPGGRFGSVVFKTSTKPLQGQTGVSIGQEVGSLVFLRIAGAIREKTDIASFKAVHAVNEYKPVDFELRIKNEGNVHLRPAGTVTITNMFGKKVATVQVDTRNVLPDAVRKMEATWKEGGRFLFGRYTATVSVVYGGNNQIVTASTSFWGLPYRLILVCLGVVTLVGIFVFRIRKRLRKAFKVLFGKG